MRLTVQENFPTTMCSLHTLLPPPFPSPPPPPSILGLEVSSSRRSSLTQTGLGSFASSHAHGSAPPCSPLHTTHTHVCTHTRTHRAFITVTYFASLSFSLDKGHFCVGFQQIAWYKKGSQHLLRE